MIENVISNTGPIVALSVIDRLEILKKLFRTVTIPESVHFELLEGGSSNLGLINYRKADWIRVEKVNRSIDPLLVTALDAGEAEVIELARQTGIDLVLIDERKARKIARTVYGLNVIGSSRILVEAKRHGLLIEVGTELQKMRDSGYYISDAIVTATLLQAGELPKV